MAWPPTLAELKDDLAVPDDELEDDDALVRRLNASVRFVQRVRKDAFVTDDDGNLIEPAIYAEPQREAETLELGTLMLAGRLFARRRSPDAVLFMAETGTSHVPWADHDIMRMLRVGRFGKPKVG
jgi:hypothetical protein